TKAVRSRCERFRKPIHYNDPVIPGKGGGPLMNSSWTRVAIAGKDADVYDPPGGRGRFGILFLHPVGLETLHDRPAFTKLFAELGLACVCPHGGRCWWADRVCPEFDPRVTPERYLLDSVVPFFAARWDIRPRAIGLLGISMGGQGALRLAFKHAAE